MTIHHIAAYVTGRGRTVAIQLTGTEDDVLKVVSRHRLAAMRRGLWTHLPKQEGDFVVSLIDVDALNAKDGSNFPHDHFGPELPFKSIQRYLEAA